MDLILGHLTKSFLRSLLDKAQGETESVKAAIAYAHDTNTLLNFCEKFGVPLRFWGRFDQGVPVSLPVLRWFLDKKSPNYLCMLVRHHHAKVIWWEGFGAYIGSANLTDAASMSATVRANGPMVSSDDASGYTPLIGTRPWVTFSP